MSNLKPGFYRIENTVNGIISCNGLEELAPMIKVDNIRDAKIFSIVQAPRQKWLITSVGGMEDYDFVARTATEKDGLIWGRIPGDIRQQTWDIREVGDNYMIYKPSADTCWRLPSPQPATQVECKELNNTEEDNNALWKLIHIEPYAMEEQCVELASGRYRINNVMHGPIKLTYVYNGHDYTYLFTPTNSESESGLWEITKISGLVYSITYLEENADKTELLSSDLRIDRDTRLRPVEPEGARLQWLIHPLPTRNTFMIFLDDHKDPVGPIHWKVKGGDYGLAVSVLHEHNVIDYTTSPGTARPSPFDEYHGPDCLWEIIPAK